MMKRVSTRLLPRPFLKWVGGKGQLLDELVRCVKLAGDFHRYHEPFVGGGALFFELVRSGRLQDKQAFLSDNNRSLIDTYCAVRDDVEAVIGRLQAHTRKHCEEYFYQVRSQAPSDLVGRAARIIYLNKTCFNGLYRENSKGQFNTPFGRYKNPLICDELNLRAVSEALQNVEIAKRPFEDVLDQADQGDLVYFDPPYHPLSKTSSFTSYDKGGFGEEAQRRLAEVFAELDRRGVYAILSNSSADFIRGLYAKRGFRLKAILATRLVNSKAEGRGKIAEVLVHNLKRPRKARHSESASDG